MKEFSVRGYWWKPDSPENQRAGILSFSPHAVSHLELFEDFTDERLGLSEFSIILGITAKGVKYTLVDCFTTSRTRHHPGFGESTLAVNMIYEGFHFRSTADLHFLSATFSFPNLSDWIVITGFDFAESFGMDEVRLAFKQPETLKFDLPQDWKLDVGFSASSHSLSTVPKEASISQKTNFILRSVTERPVDEFHKIIYHLKNLISFMTLRSQSIAHIVFFTGQNTIDIHGTQYRDEVNVFFSQSRNTDQSKDLHPLDMIFAYPSIQSRFQDILLRWFSPIESLRDVLSLYFYTISSPFFADEIKLTNLAGVVEALHRKLEGGVFQNKAEFEKTIFKELAEKIPKELDRDFRDSLKSRIKYGYEFSLRRRITEIVKASSRVMFQLFDDTEKLKLNIVETRNFYTHYDELTKNVVDRDGLPALCEQIEAIIIVMLLRLLGFDEDEVLSFFVNSWKLKRLVKKIEG